MKQHTQYIETMTAHYIAAMLWEVSADDGELLDADYIAAMLWDVSADDGELLDADYSADDLAPEAYARAAADCASFYWRALPWLGEWTAEQAGHDFWLTRQHHCAGFWDRGKDHGDALTDIAHHYCELWPYVGDDGLIYLN